MTQTPPPPSHGLQARREEIDSHLQAYIAGLPERQGVETSPNGAQAFRLLSEFALRPAKRVRGILGVVGYEMFGGGNHAAALDLAVALELAQAYLLIVDDVMDRSAQRRGGPSVQLQYRELLEQANYPTKDAEHIGDMLAINVGLVVQHLAAGLLNGLDETPERVMHTERLFHANMMVTGLGQIDDMFHAAGQPATEEDIRRKYIQKTSHYTFVNPLQMGAALAGAGEAELVPLHDYGVQAGLAFQIQDDVLGMFGDEQASGKSALDDLWEGKLTLMMQYAFDHASPVQRQVIDAAFGNPAATPEQHRAVCAVLEDVGARAYAERAAADAAGAAQRVLDTQVGWDAAARTFLGQLLTYVISRSS